MGQTLNATLTDGQSDIRQNKEGLDRNVVLGYGGSEKLWDSKGLFSYCKKGEPNLAPVSQVDACYRKDVNGERFLSRSPKTTAHSFFVSSFLKKLQIRAEQQSVGLLPPLFVPKPAVFYFLARSRFNARQLPPISKRIASVANTRKYFNFKDFQCIVAVAVFQRESLLLPMLDNTLTKIFNVSLLYSL